MSAPKPGRPVRGSHSGRPIMALFDLMGRRWAMRLIWILRERPLLFRELQAACDGASSSVIARRLAELKEAGIVAPGPDGYALTDEGLLLLEAYGPLWTWAERWAQRTGASKRRK